MGDGGVVGAPRGSDLIVEVDASGSVRRVGAAARVLGFPQEPAATAWELLARVHPDDASRIRSLVTTSRSQPGLAARDRVRFRRPDGVWIEVDLAIRPLPDGAVASYLERWAPTTPPEGWGRHLLDATPTPLGILSDEGRFVAANRTLCLLLGYEEMELHDRSPRTLAHPDDWARSERLDQIMAAGAISVETELRWLRADGSAVEVVERRGRVTEGPVGGVIVTLSELRPRRGEPDAAMAATVLDAASTILLAVDPQGKVALANRAAVTAAGVADDLVHRQLAELFPPPNGSPGVAEVVPVAATDQAVHDLEAPFAAPDGTVHVLAWTARAVVQPDGATLVVLTGADITERQATLTELAHRALHDPLTHLPNRNLLRERLGHALTRLERSGSDLAVLFIDLNHFKAVNDQFGHQAGDRVLAVLASRLQGAVRPSDTIARLGGDEFIVLCEDITDARSAFEIADRLVEAVETPVRVDGDDDRHEVRVSASVGIAFARHSGADADALLRQADAAMYQAKRRGSQMAESPTDPAPLSGDSRTVTEDDILAALDGDGIVVLYQPEISLSQGRVTGVEALVRLRHPTVGLISPSAFLPLAERTDLIVRIGARVMDEVARQVAAWRRFGTEVRVSVNLSHRELAVPGAARRIAHSLEEAGTSAASIVIDVTEHVLLDTSEEAAVELRALKQLGAKVAVDDAGTGFVTAALVRDLPVDLVKVDARFIHDLGDDADTTPVVASILRLARTLDLQTVGEGVETAPQLAALRSLGCDAAHGYFFAPPQPAAVIADLLRPDFRWPTTPLPH